MMLRTRRSKGGFTLLEVVAAITILAMGVTSILVSFNGMNESHRLMKRRTRASFFAREVITWVRSQTLTPDSEETEGEFPESDYRYKVEFKPTDFTGLYAVNCEVSWGKEDSPEKISVYTLQYFDGKSTP